MEESLVRYLHFLGIITLSATLFAENMMIKKQMLAVDMRKLAFIDAIYGMSALLTLGAGLALWLWIGKPAEFYSKNPLFHIKVTLFVLVALLSIIPTVFFVKNRDLNSGSIEIPDKILRILRIELAILPIFPFLAVLIARGIGLSH